MAVLMYREALQLHEQEMAGMLLVMAQNLMALNQELPQISQQVTF